MAVILMVGRTQILQQQYLCHLLLHTYQCLLCYFSRFILDIDTLDNINTMKLYKYLIICQLYLVSFLSYKKECIDTYIIETLFVSNNTYITF